MPSLTLKGIPDHLLDALRKLASQQRRSLNSQVIHLLENSVGPRPVDVEVALERIHRLQQEIPLPPLTEAILEEALDEGRG